jgi:hypothetical protein
MKSLLPILLLASIVAVGCDMGDTPVETVNVNTTQPPPGPPAGVNAGAPTDMKSAIENNPNMPPAAKNAVLGKR